MASDWRSIPNLITLTRLASMPVFIALLWRHQPFAALVLFAAAMASDVLDGVLARLLHQQTRLGALLDPLADKALLVTGLVALVGAGRAPAWLLGLVLLRDFTVAGGALEVRRRKLGDRLEPTRIGKYATFALTCQIVLALAGLAVDWPLFDAYAAVMAFIAGLCVAVSTAQYLARIGVLLAGSGRGTSVRTTKQ